MPTELLDATVCDLASAATVSEAPFSAKQLQQVADAHARAKKIRKAAGVANFNAWVSAVLAAGALPFALSSLVDAISVVALGSIAYNEFRGRRLLLRFEPRGAAVLAWNQFGLFALITVYCIWKLIAGGGALSAELTTNREVMQALGSMEELETLMRFLTLLLYGGTIAASAIFQGLTALYYFSRKKMLDSYLRDTPKWVITLQQTTATS